MMLIGLARLYAKYVLRRQEKKALVIASTLLSVNPWTFFEPSMYFRHTLLQIKDEARVSAELI
jgi:hypothetical protein